MNLHDSEIIELNGRRYLARTYYDEDSDAPWENSDGHGPVSEWTQRNKRAGEVVLWEDRSSKRYYDLAKATRMAKRDGWGLGEEAKQELIKRLENKRRFAIEFDDQRGVTKWEERQDRDVKLQPLTKGEITAEAVRLDFEFLRRWCNNDWYYIGVSVTHIPKGCEDEEDLPDDYTYACWGVESEGDYWREVAADCARDCEAEVLENLEALKKERADVMEKTKLLETDIAKITAPLSVVLLLKEAIAARRNKLYDLNCQITELTPKENPS